MYLPDAVTFCNELLDGLTPQQFHRLDDLQCRFDTYISGHEIVWADDWTDAFSSASEDMIEYIDSQRAALDNIREMGPFDSILEEIAEEIVEILEEGFPEKFETFGVWT